jgi:hypothetical protein
VPREKTASDDFVLWRGSGDEGICSVLDAAFRRSVNDLEAAVLRSVGTISILLSGLVGETMSTEARRRGMAALLDVGVAEGVLGDMGDEGDGGRASSSNGKESAVFPLFLLAGHMYSMILPPTLVSSCNRNGWNVSSKPW